MRSYIFIFFYAIILLLPDIFLIEAPSPRGYYISIIFNFGFYFACASLLEFFGICLKKFWHFLYSFYHIIIHILIYSYSLSTIFLFTKFNLGWNSFTFQLINETNLDETKGFLETYLYQQEGLFILLFVIGLLTCEYIVHHYLSKIILKLPTYIKVIYIIICLGFLSELRFFSTNPDYNYYNSDKLIKRVSLWSIHQSYLQYKNNRNQFDRCATALNDLKLIGASKESKNIILVIGETHIRRHSSIYNYPLPTNPFLEIENNLEIFTNVISPLNATTICFQNFMSMASVDDSLDWCDAPLFPAFFKEVGYNVVFFSNQYVQKGAENFYDASAGFFNHPKVQSALFTTRNHQKFQFDGEMISHYKSNRLSLEKDSLNLIIFHLKGQHSPAIERYPKEETFFTSEDIKREDLTINERDLIAQYDNATRYNDKIIKSIIDLYRNKDVILIYFADHGEEVFDVRHKAGRFFDYKVGGKPALECQLEIPFLIWYSDEYKNKHPHFIKQIKAAKDNPFMTDDLPHLLLYLAGIETAWYNPKRCLIENHFNTERKRWIGEIDYDTYGTN